MQEYEEPPLFGQGPAPLEFRRPPLPVRPVWRAFTGGTRDQCDYCVQWASMMATPPDFQICRPMWRRLGCDGATLLLCAGHGRLFDAERPSQRL